MSLALAYQEAFKTIVRLQSGKLKGQTAAQVKASLLSSFKAIDGDASKWRPDTLRDATFAVAAFADETALTNGDPLITNQWNTPQKAPPSNGAPSKMLRIEHLDINVQSPPNAGLILALFAEANAGNEFYRRLERIRLEKSHDSRELLEVYCLCLTLGYTGAQRGEQLRRTTQESIKEISVVDQGLVVGNSGLAGSPASAPARRLWLPVTLGLVLVAYAFFWINLATSAANVTTLAYGHHF